MARGKPTSITEQADALLTYLILGVIVGGRLGYVLFYNLPYYAANPFDIIRIWDGGMAFHGGFVGVVLAVIIYCFTNKIPLWSGADRLPFRRLPDCFWTDSKFHKCGAWGKPTDAPWGVVFPGDRAQDCEGVVGLCARHPSQIYEALLEGLVLFFILIILIYFRSFKRPGLVTGVFAIGYGLSRFLVEYFRVPDPQFFSNSNPYGFAIKAGEYGLTMGQTLTLPMILFGLMVMTYSFRSASAKSL